MSLLQQLHSEKWIEEVIDALNVLYNQCKDNCPSTEEIERISSYISNIGLTKDINVQHVKTLVFIGVKIMSGTQTILKKINEIAIIKANSTALDKELVLVINFVKKQKSDLEEDVIRMLKLCEELKFEMTNAVPDRPRILRLKSDLSLNAEQAATKIEKCREKLWSADQNIKQFIESLRDEKVMTNEDLRNAGYVASAVFAVSRFNPTVGRICAAVAGVVGVGIVGSRVVGNTVNQQEREKIQEKSKKLKDLKIIIKENEDEIKMILGNVSRFTEDVERYYSSAFPSSTAILAAS